MRRILAILILLTTIAGCNREPPLLQIPPDENTKELIRKADSIEALHMNLINKY